MRHADPAHRASSADATYAIRVRGHLDGHWSNRLADLVISHHADGTSTLAGAVADQAELRGVLTGLSDIGAEIIEIRTLEAPDMSVVAETRYAPSRAEQRTARIMGAWFLGTFLFSIPAFFLYGPILDGAEDVMGSGAGLSVGFGALLEILLSICGIATAVVIFPIARRSSESVALGYVACRTVESVLILVGVLGLLTVVALRSGLAAGPSTYAVTNSLVDLHEQTRLLGPQLCAGLGNGILLGIVMWRSRLLPRPMVMLGLIGGPLALVAGIGVLLGAWNMTAGLPVALTVPEAAWELSLSVWLLVKGFRPSPVLSGVAVSGSAGADGADR